MEAKRRNFDRADNGDASATPDASKFAFVRERTSNLAGRATAASFIGDAFVSPRCGGYFPFNWSTNCVACASRGRRVMAPGPLWVSGQKPMQFVSAADATLKTQHKNEIFDLTLAPRVDPGEIFVAKFTAKTRAHIVVGKPGGAVVANLTH